jgi:hypothetical protein
VSVEESKAVVGRWFTEFWDDSFNPDAIADSPHRMSGSTARCALLPWASARFVRRPACGGLSMDRELCAEGTRPHEMPGWGVYKT